MVKNHVFTSAFVPDKFQSIEELHKLGFALEHEREELSLEQPWIQRAKQMDISQAELGRRCGLTRQGISYAASKGKGMDVLTALLICEALAIPVEEGFRISGSQYLYVPCRRCDENLFVNLCTLDVVFSSKRKKTENYERLYYIQNRKGECAGGP